MPVAPSTSIFNRRLVIALAASCLLQSSAFALPTGWQVQSGQVSFQQNGGTLTITSQSDHAVVQYITFNMASGETVNFILPNAGASILNQVIGGQSSQIAGTINANGQIAIVNPAGIQIATSAQINALGLLASTLTLKPEDFGRSDWLLNKDPGAAAAVVNEGQIQIGQGGYAVLAGSSVVNKGSVIAPDGHIELAVGDKITVHLSNRSDLQVTVDDALKQSVDGLNAAISNSGRLEAHTVGLQARLSDQILQNAVNNDGIIMATGLSNEGGKLRIFADTPSGGALVQNTGVLDASGTAQAAAGNIQVESDTVLNSGRVIAIGGTGHAGGSVQMLGATIKQTGSATVDVSGDTGGGTALIGGDQQGQGLLRRALLNEAGENVLLKADALNSGNGGKIINWADGLTRFAGNVSARGGAHGGNGGFVEISGKQDLAFDGYVDTRAPLGNTGWLLLDPTTITINNGNGTNNTTTGVYYEKKLEAQSSNIILSATNGITVNNLNDSLLDLDYSLSMDAGSGNITFADTNDRIRTPGKDISMSAGGTMTLGILDTTNSSSAVGNISLDSGGSITANALYTNTGNVSITTASGNVGTSANPIDTDTGSLTLNLAGNGYFQEADAITVNTSMVGGNFQLRNSTAGNITVNNLNVTGTTDIQTASGANSSILGTGNVFHGATNLNTNDDTGGNITLSADFQGDTTVWGDVINLTNTAGNLSIPSWYSGGSANSFISALSSGANVTISLEDLKSGGQGKLQIDADKNITFTKIPAAWAFDDFLVLNSRNGGDITFDTLLMGNFNLQGGTSAYSIASSAQGISAATNGGRFIFNNVDSTGPLTFNSGGNDIITTAGGNIFRNSVAFNAGTTGNIAFNTGTNDFQSTTNSFTGKNITLADSSGSLTVSSATASGNLTLSSASAGNIALSNVTVNGTTNVTTGGNNATITGSTGLVFKGAANFNTQDNSGGDITLSGDFQGNTTFTGDRIQATDTSGDFTVTGISTGSTSSTSTLTASGSNANLSVSGLTLDSSGATQGGRLDLSVPKNISVDGTGWTTTNDTLNVNSTSAGNLTLSNTTLTGSATLTGQTGTANSSSAGIVLGTNGGSLTLNSVTSPTAVSMTTNNGAITLGTTGQGVSFAGTTAFSAGTADVTGVGSFTGAVSGTAGRIYFDATSGNFVANGLTASSASGWNGTADQTLYILAETGNISGNGFTTSAAGNMLLQAGKSTALGGTRNINVTGISANQNLSLFATGDTVGNGTGTSISASGTVGGLITATGINASNQFAATTGGINFTASSGNLKTALVWAGGNNAINLTASNGSILQDTSLYSASSTGVAGGKTVWGSGAINLTAQGSSASYIDTGVMALTASGSGGNVTAKAQGDSAGNGTGVSINLRGRSDGTTTATNLSSGNTTGDVYLGTSIGASQTDLNDSPSTVMDVMGATTVKSAGNVKLYGSFWGPITVTGKTVTGTADKGNLNFSNVAATATSGTTINLTALQGNLTGSTISTVGTADIFLQAGSVLSRDYRNTINLTNVTAARNLTVVVAGSSNGLSSGTSVTITGSKGGTSSATKVGGGAPLGSVSMP